MTAFATKNFNTTKSDKVRATYGRVLQLGRSATDQEVNDQLTIETWKKVKDYDRMDGIATVNATADADLP